MIHTQTWFIALFLVLQGYMAVGQKGSDNVKKKFNYLTIQAGIHQQKEQILAPLTHTGYLVGVNYSKGREEGEAGRFTTGFSYARLKSKHEPLSADIALGLHFGYVYGFEVYHSDNLSICTGPYVKLAYNIGYYPMWDDSHFYWANTLSSGLQNVLIYTLKNSNQIVGTLDLPLLSLLSRPPEERLYKIDDLSFKGLVGNFHDNLRFGTLETVFLLDMTWQYRYSLGQKRRQSIGYTARYARYKGKSGSPFQNTRHLFNITLYF